MPATTRRRSIRPATSDALRIRALAESLQAVYVPGEDGGRLLLWTAAARAPAAADVRQALELLGASAPAGAFAPGRHVLAADDVLNAGRIVESFTVRVRDLFSGID